MFKKLLKKENLVLIILIFLLGHNILLHIKLDRAISRIMNLQILAYNAQINSANAAIQAEKAAVHAEEAAKNAKDAFYASYDNICSNCP